MRRAILALVVVALVALPCCKGLDPTLTGPAVFDRCDMLDAYTEADPALTDKQKAATKQTSDFLRKLWKTAGYDPDAKKAGGE